MTIAKDTTQRHPQHIIGASLRRAVRDAYRLQWTRDWPHEERYLAELIIEAKADLGLPANSKQRRHEVIELALVLMRADHEFTAEPKQ